MTGESKGRIEKIIDKASHVFLVLSGILIVIMMLTASYGVVRRYVFNSPEPYSYELSTMFLLFSFVFAISAVERLDRHIRVDFISSHLSHRWQYIILNVIAPVMGLLFAIMLTWKGVDVALFSLKIGEVSSSSWREPLFPIKLMVPLGYAMLLLVLLTRICKGIAALRKTPGEKSD